MAVILKTIRDRLPEFCKVDAPRFMVAKMIRFHHLAERMIRDGRIVYLIRNPCGHVNSWLRSPELPKGAGPNEWRTGERKKKEEIKGGILGYCGFDDWKSVALAYLSLAKEHPERCRIQRYEELVDDTIPQTQQMFEWCGVPFTAQTEKFIRLSRTGHSDDPYAVVKAPSLVRNRWKRELDISIRDEILKEVDGTPLAAFL